MGAGSRYRSITAAAARHAGRVNFGPTVRRSNLLVFSRVATELTARWTLHGTVVLVLCFLGDYGLRTLLVVLLS